VLVASGVFGQEEEAEYYDVDDFTCPDEYKGFFPHLISCDKYWACDDGVAELRTCGNGLAFLDTDEEYELEQCEEDWRVDCGERTQLEPAIASPHCPKAWGTFADEEDECGVFWKCQDGKANMYECAFGTAFDPETRNCIHVSQVPSCSAGADLRKDSSEEFKCPPSNGAFTKHPNPDDCGKFYLCISGIPRDQTCVAGLVFSYGTGNGIDGQCAPVEDVPECEGYEVDPDNKDASRVERRRK